MQPGAELEEPSTRGWSLYASWKPGSFGAPRLSCRDRVTHSLKYFYTASSGAPNFPEFVSVAMVDDVQTDHYDSNTQRAEPKQDWMNKVATDDPQYWERNTGIYMGSQQVYKASADILKKRFDQTGGDQ